MIGTLRGIRKVLPHLNARIVVRRDGKGSEEGGYQATMRVLRSLSPRKRILIAAANDSTALGALRAVQECGHERFAAIVGQGFNPDPFLEDTIRRPGSPLIGTVGYFPERYGSKIMPAVLRWLNNEQVPPAIHTDHVLVTRANIDELCTQRAHCALRADQREHLFE
jgi:ribose transport system substrate-binding protein